nr:hypothetical protein [Tanacetum cinerariifolium]
MELELEHTQQSSSYEVSVEVCSSLRSLKSKRTIKSRAKGSSKRISLGHYLIMLASSHTVKSKTDIKSPTHYPCAPQITPSFVQSAEQVKPPRHSVQPVETSIHATTPKPTSPKEGIEKLALCAGVGTNQQNASFTHKHPPIHMVPAVVLTQSKPVFNTTVRPVSAVVPKIMVTRPRHAHSPVTKYKSPIRRNITRSPSPKTSNSPPKATAVKTPVTDDLDAFDSDCDEAPSARAMLMANLSSYDSDVLLEAPISDTFQDNLVLHHCV